MVIYQKYDTFPITAEYNTLIPARVLQVSHSQLLEQILSAIIVTGSVGRILR